MCLKIINILVLVMLVSCSVFKNKQGSVQINSSQPAVEIFVIHPSQERSEKLIGTTPLNVSLDDIDKDYFQNKRLTLLAKKSGFVTQIIDFEAYSATNHKFELRMETINWWANKKSVEANQVVQTVVSEVYKYQQKIKDGNLVEASAIVSSLLEAYPSVSHFHHSMGVIKYLQKNYVSAEALFKRAIELDGDNSEAKIMLNVTQKKMKE